MTVRRGHLGKTHPAQGKDLGSDGASGVGGEGGRRAAQAAAAAHAPGANPGDTPGPLPRNHPAGIAPVGGGTVRAAPRGDWRIEHEVVARDAQADASAADVLRRRLASLIARALAADGSGKAPRGADV